MEDVYFETIEEGWRLINKAIEDGYNYANPLWPLEVIMEDIRNSLEPHPISLVRNKSSKIWQTPSKD
jgi:hypothetical protein